MTNPVANTDATFEFSLDQLVLNAHRVASLMNPAEQASGPTWEANRKFGLQCVEMVVKRIEAQGKLVRARKFLFLTLVAGVYEYSLDNTIMDLLEDGAFIPVGQDINAANGETPVKPIDMEQWNRLGTHANQGRPCFYFTYRATEPLTVRVWPTPSTSEAGTIRFQAYRFLGESTDGQYAVDLERYWANYVTYAVAALLAEAANQPADKVTRLEMKAAELLTEAKSYSHQRTPGQVVVSHRGPVYFGRRWR